MRTVRTIIWVLLALALLIFSLNNWKPVEIKIWEDLLVVTKLPALVIVSFLAGFLPVWLLHRGSQWQLHRRIASLETAVRSAVAPKPAEPVPPVDEEPGPPQT